MIEYRTAKGRIVRVGDEFKDSRRTNVRTLRIDRLQAEDYGAVRAFCTVVRQKYDGKTTEPMRQTDMIADRFGGYEFKPADAPDPVEELDLFSIEGEL